MDDRAIEIVRSSPLFDSDWYLQTYPDVRLSGLDPALHYSVVGWRIGRSPSLAFDASAYLRRYPDIAESGLNPLWHYEVSGKREGRRIESAQALSHRRAQLTQPGSEGTTFDGKYLRAYEAMVSTAHGARAPEFAPIRLSAVPASSEAAKPLAFYLPQFHPVPENDRSWGIGFTEWTNVSKASPQFDGHYQPRLPGELGFYDLRISDIMRRQIELARLYGVYGFCFHYYWFSGHRVLEKPLETFLSNKEPAFEFPFCLCWANENWTKRWDGADNEIILQQNHSLIDHEAVFQDLCRFFSDERYIKIDGKPVIVIYRPGIINSLSEMVRIWRNLAISAGFEGIYLVATTAFGFSDPELIGFDAICEFPPHEVSVPEISSDLDLLNPSFTGKIFDYRVTVDNFLNNLNSASAGRKSTRFPGVMMGWDNEARRPSAGHVYTGCRPTDFYRWVKGSAEYCAKKLPADRRYIFVNAWNEWAEGTYLEPDRKFGYAMLTALSAALTEEASYHSPKITILKPFALDQIRPKNKLAIIAHVFYPDLLIEMAEAFSLIKKSWEADLIVTIPNTWSTSEINTATKLLEPSALIICENRGRDILPFLYAHDLALKSGFEFSVKLHSKKSLHVNHGDDWRRSLYQDICSGHAVSEVRKIFTNESDAGIVAPRASLHEYTLDAMAHNGEIFNNIVSNLPSYQATPRHFIAGSMFWYRLKAFKNISFLDLSRERFGPELGAIDGTLAHAIERAFPHIAASGGFRTISYE